MTGKALSQKSRDRSKKGKSLTADLLRELLEYDQETGEFFWRRRRAGSYNKIGYLTIGIGGTKYYGHRLAHLYMTGEWPEYEVDHKDGTTSNNRWNNLRPATSQQNKQNRPINSNNKSGFKNVIYLPTKYPERPWVGKIMVNRKSIYVGHFATPAQAADAVQAARLVHFGEYSRGR